MLNRMCKYMPQFIIDIWNNTFIGFSLFSIIWGTYNFFSHICPNEPEPTDEEIEELSVSPFEK